MEPWTKAELNPRDQWCHNRRWRAYGRPGEGHVVIHSHKERRYQYKRCRRTFSETRGTAFYRVRKPKWLLEIENAACLPPGRPDHGLM